MTSSAENPAPSTSTAAANTATAEAATTSISNINAPPAVVSSVIESLNTTEQVAAPNASRNDVRTYLHSF